MALDGGSWWFVPSPISEAGTVPWPGRLSVEWRELTFEHYAGKALETG